MADKKNIMYKIKREIFRIFKQIKNFSVYSVLYSVLLGRDNAEILKNARILRNKEILDRNGGGGI